MRRRPGRSDDRVRCRAARPAFEMLQPSGTRQVPRAVGENAATVPHGARGVGEPHLALRGGMRGGRRRARPAGTQRPPRVASRNDEQRRARRSSLRQRASENSARTKPGSTRGVSVASAGTQRRRRAQARRASRRKRVEAHGANVSAYAALRQVERAHGGAQVALREHALDGGQAAPDGAPAAAYAASATRSSACARAAASTLARAARRARGARCRRSSAATRRSTADGRARHDRPLRWPPARCSRGGQSRPGSVGRITAPECAHARAGRVASSP